MVLGFRRARSRIVGLCLLFLVSQLAAPVLGNSYFAGYYARCFQKWGISAHIYTIDPSVGLSVFAEWVMIVLSFDREYWVSLGYRKRWLYGRDYFMEKQDANGYEKRILGSVSPDTWHTYKIVTDGYGVWRCYIDGVNKGAYVTDPPDPSGQWASAETKSKSIRIDGSEFRQISYYEVDNGHWYLWYFHGKAEDPPYHVTELDDYWFIAWGGG